jgi:NusA-like KH domain protein
MSKIKYSEEQMKFMSYFESVTKTKVKDCFTDLRSILTFVVEQNQIIKAVGKNASNVQLLEKKLNKKIRIVEYSSDLKVFVKNLVHPNKAADIKIEDNIIYVTPADLKSRGYMIGKSAIMLKTNMEIMKRFYPEIVEIKILQVPEGAEKPAESSEVAESNERETEISSVDETPKDESEIDQAESIESDVETEDEESDSDFEDEDEDDKE